MATILLSAAGMAVGGSLGGSVLSLHTAVIGRAVGATLGRVVDQRIMGAGSEPVTTGKVDRFRLTGASEGAPVQQLFGTLRLGGQVIWASRFGESETRSGGGKGTSRPATTSYSYTVSLAIALCEGEITRVGRIWADGVEVAADALNMRVYSGASSQMPDPKIEAVEGAGAAPAYRGVAYVVFEDLQLGQFGNRVPQFSFEVSRPSQPEAEVADIARLVQGVALVPGTGEYALATTPVYQNKELGHTVPVNINSASGQADISSSLDAMQDELPNCGSVSLVVSWFGNDLRCGDCAIMPKVEQTEFDPKDMPWEVTGVSRSSAQMIAQIDGRPIYGGTPADASVKEAIVDLNGRGKNVVFYPFILMEQMDDNALPDPWTGQVGQPYLPWRGRVTLSVAPGQAGTPDQTTTAEAEVAAFMGSAQSTDFASSGGTVHYTGPTEFSYRRFILHYAHLCAAAGGVDAFCIGSEMRSLTQIRGAGGSFPAVDALRQLASDVRGILGASCKIGYAADWSEYHGYQPVGTGDKIFHLDPLWADPEIDFIGIDNYMPLSDWREGDDHLDADWCAVHNLEYLQSNIEGGEGYDWFYHSVEARDAQIRTPISDFWGEHWVWRYKDIRGWWANYHHNRIGGERAKYPTVWEPGSKPIWFTELGCAAVDKATNAPNKFVDPKSSESGLPPYSTGLQDELIQHQYLRAMMGFYLDPANNPIWEETGVQMLDASRAHVWAWDARPHPHFPNNRDLWSDGENYARGHWISGRSSARPLDGVVAEICKASGVEEIDTSMLFGLVRGYGVTDVESARSALQPLMLAYGFDVIERDGVLKFVTRGLNPATIVDPDMLVFKGDDTPTRELTRAPEAELSGRVRINFIEASGDYETGSVEAALSDDRTLAVSQSEFPLSLTRSEGQRLAERWLAESRLARETTHFTLPPSQRDIGAGDLVTIGSDLAVYRIDQLEIGSAREAEAVRVERSVYRAHALSDEQPRLQPFVLPVPVEGVFLDLPLIRGDEAPHAPHLAAFARPWPGGVALYSSAQDHDYGLNLVNSKQAVVGVTESLLGQSRCGIVDRGPSLRVRMLHGALDSVSVADVLSGANVAVIGDPVTGTWEVFQFAKAELVAADTYDLSDRLRGQAGSDGEWADVWPEGSLVFLVNSGLAQISLPKSARGVTQHYRWGPEGRPMDHASFSYLSADFAGNGLRPYRPCHLRASQDGAGGWNLSWIRRTRIDGDNWDGLDVPLGEQSEAYLLRVIEGGVIKREVVLSEAEFSYSGAMQTTDGINTSFRVEVAQLSQSFGAGPSAQLTVV